jgi:hypothetical protein
MDHKNRVKGVDLFRLSQNTIRYVSAASKICGELRQLPSYEPCSLKLVNRSVLYTKTVKPGYNDIGLCDTTYIPSDILWYQLTPHC